MSTVDSVLLDRWATETKITYSQKVAKLKGKTREVYQGAKTFNFELFATEEADVGGARGQDINVTAQNASVLTATAQRLYKAYYIDDMDQAMVSFDYRNVITEKAVEAVNRAFDDTVLTAVQTAVSNSFGTNVTSLLPTANTLNYGGVVQFANALDLSDVDETERFLISGTTGYNQLIQDATFIDNFHVYNNAVSTGQIPGGQAAGFSVTKSTRVQQGSTSSYKRAVGFHKAAIGTLIAEDLSIDINWIAEKQSWLFVARMYVGSVVIDPLGIAYADITK